MCFIITINVTYNILDYFDQIIQQRTYSIQFINIKISIMLNINKIVLLKSHKYLENLIKN